MFSENLKTLRKSRGFSQEELSIRLNVVRQTISKWEKGVSVPDAEMLIKIAEVLETTVSGLLGEKIIDEKDKNDISQQLSRINEQLAIKNRRSKFVLKLVLSIIIVIIVFNILMIILSMISFKSFQNNRSEVIQQTEMQFFDD